MAGRFPFVLWTVFGSPLFFCATAVLSSHNSYPSYDVPNPEQYWRSHRIPADPQWGELNKDGDNYPYYTTGKDSQEDMTVTKGDYLAFGTWPENDSRSAAHQFLNDKSTDSMQSTRALGFENSDLVNEGDMFKQKREGHSLSIVNPLDVLRQRLMLEMARRRMKENQEQIRENELLLKNLGKRSASIDGAHINNDDKGESRPTTKNYFRRQQVSDSEDYEV